jgi:hypothetical protein
MPGMSVQQMISPSRNLARDSLFAVAVTQVVIAGVMFAIHFCRPLSGSSGISAIGHDGEAIVTLVSAVVLFALAAFAKGREKLAGIVGLVVYAITAAIYLRLAVHSHGTSLGLGLGIINLATLVVLVQGVLSSVRFVLMRG